MVAMHSHLLVQAEQTSQSEFSHPNRFETLCTTRRSTAKSFVLQCPFDSTTASFRGTGNVIVKLKNLHPIFECMVFPIKGLHLKLTLFCNYASFQPFVCSNGAAPVVKNQ